MHPPGQRGSTGISVRVLVNFLDIIFLANDCGDFIYFYAYPHNVSYCSVPGLHSLYDIFYFLTYFFKCLLRLRSCLVCRSREQYFYL